MIWVNHMPNYLRRSLVVVLVLSVLTVVAGILLAWVYGAGCFSHTNFQRIQSGMSREQVTALLGSPGEETKSIPGFPEYVHLPGAPPG
jgi:outer membrane protein assembly factor BamE (lipoprotein component of BamABCDE complex)